LRTGIMSPAIRRTHHQVHAVAPSDHIDCPEWDRFLRETTGGDRDMVRFLQQWAGYCLTATSESTLFCSPWPGGNGKSVFLNTLTGIMADYSTPAPATHSRIDRRSASDGARGSLWCAPGGGQRNRTRPHMGRNPDQTAHGGDEVAARYMRAISSGSTVVQLTIIGNHRPKLENVDAASAGASTSCVHAQAGASRSPARDKLREDGRRSCVDDRAARLAEAWLIRPARVLARPRTISAIRTF